MTLHLAKEHTWSAFAKDGAAMTMWRGRIRGAYRYPYAAVTAWEDISLFYLCSISCLALTIVGYAVKTYPKVTYIYTCPGNGIPIADAEAMVDPTQLQPDLPQGASLLGIPGREERC